MGIVAEVIAKNTPAVGGYRRFRRVTIAPSVRGWDTTCHAGRARDVHFFQTTTMISQSIGDLLTCLILSLWGGSIRFTPPMLFALAFLPMFGIGGLTGLPLGLASPDIHFHDTYYVIAHFHYVVAPGTLFALFAGVYYWYPKATGRYMSTSWSTCLLAQPAVHQRIFMRFSQGLAGMRGGSTRAASPTPHRPVLWLHKVISISAWGLALAQIPSIVQLLLEQAARGRRPPTLGRHTLEWALPRRRRTATSRRAGGLRGPTSTASPSRDRLLPAERAGARDGVADPRQPAAGARLRSNDVSAIPYTVETSPDTGLTTSSWGSGSLLSSEGCCSVPCSPLHPAAHRNPAWGKGSELLSVPMAPSTPWC